MLNRAQRKAIGESTLAIVKAGTYTTPRGVTVALSQPMSACIQGTQVVKDTDTLPTPPPPSRPDALRSQPSCLTEVTTESTLGASQRLCRMHPGKHVACLNFASAHNPGGGFLGGSQAQEESLARNSGLYASQTSNMAMYEYNGRLKKNNIQHPHTLYSDYMMYSPRVPVFRDEGDGSLLDEPYMVSIISAPAPNAGATITNYGKKHGVEESVLWEQITQRMRARIVRILSLAYREGCECLVLGAYGCGVFKNKPSIVADVFRDALGEGGTFHNAFTHVVFAVYASSPTDKTYCVFSEVLGDVCGAARVE